MSDGWCIEGSAAFMTTAASTVQYSYDGFDPPSPSRSHCGLTAAESIPKKIAGIPIQKKKAILLLP
jgi:hypothetical protein